MGNYLEDQENGKTQKKIDGQNSIKDLLGCKKKTIIGSVVVTCSFLLYYWCSKIGVAEPFFKQRPLIFNGQCSGQFADPTSTTKNHVLNYETNSRSCFAVMTMGNRGRTRGRGNSSQALVTVPSSSFFSNFGNIPGRNPAVGTNPLRTSKFQQCQQDCLRCFSGGNSGSSLPQKNEMGIVPAEVTAVSPPVPQFMEARQDSATRSFKATGSFRNVTNDVLENSLHQKKVYGAQCFSRRYLALPQSIETNLSNLDGLTPADDLIFPVYQPGSNITTARTNLVTKVNAENLILHQNNENKKIVIFEQGEEIRGNQARFCVFLDKTRYRIEKVDVIVWKSDNGQKVKMLFLGHIPYDLKLKIKDAVKEQISDFKTSLPNLATIADQNWVFQNNLEFDHYIGSTDASFLGIEHETAQTHILHRFHNRSRNMDYPNLNAPVFRTDLAKDQVSELLEQFDLNNEASPFLKYRENTYKADGTLKNPSDHDAIPLNILVQLESSYFFHHLESSRTLEFKARCTRVDVEPLGVFTQADIDFFDLQRIPHVVPDGNQPEPDHLVFEFQKTTRNGAFVREITKELIEKLQDNYSCQSWEKMILVIDDLVDLMKINVQHGNLECAVLNLGGNNETKCLLNRIRLEKLSIHNSLHESINQLKFINNDLIPPSGTDAQKKFDEISDKIEDLRVNNESEPIITSVDEFKEGVTEIQIFDESNAIYKNNLTRSLKMFPKNLQNLKKHVHEGLIIEAEKIHRGRPPLTGVFGV